MSKILGITNLPKILVQEEIDSYDITDNEEQLTALHNDALRTLALVHIVSKIARPLCDDFEDRLKTVNMRTKTLEDMRRKLKEQME